MKKNSPYLNFDKIVSHSNILLLVIFIVIGCDRIVDPEGDQDKAENLIAFTAVFPDNTDDSYFEKLIIADFYDLDNYEVLSNIEKIHLGPVFSGDKSKILYGVPGDEDGNGKIKLFDIHKNQMESLEVKNPDAFTGSTSLYGENVVWNQESTGFYYGKRYPNQGAYFYSFSDSSSTTLRLNVFPLALKDNDTLFVYGNPEYPEIPHGFYLMDTNGDYIERIQNPYWDELDEITGIHRGAQALDYNRQSNLLVFIVRDSELRGDKVAVISLEGNYYQEYTAGNYLDSSPRWGPDGTILFVRMPLPVFGSRVIWHKIMKINTETGEVTEFITRDQFPDASSLLNPDF